MTKAWTKEMLRCTCWTVLPAFYICHWQTRICTSQRGSQNQDQPRYNVDIKKKVTYFDDCLEMDLIFMLIPVTGVIQGLSVCFFLKPMAVACPKSVSKHKCRNLATVWEIPFFKMKAKASLNLKALKKSVRIINYQDYCDRSALTFGLYCGHFTLVQCRSKSA